MSLPSGHAKPDGTGPIDYHLTNPQDFGIVSAIIIWSSYADAPPTEGYYQLEIQDSPRSRCGPSTSKTVEGNIAAFKSHISGNRYLNQQPLFKPVPKWKVWEYPWTKEFREVEA